MKGCFMCEREGVFENELAKAFYDQFPVSEGHMFFVTKRHVPTFFDTTQEERIAIFELIDKEKKCWMKNTIQMATTLV